MSLLTNMPHTVEIRRPTYQRKPGDLGELQHNPVKASNVPAWVQNRSRAELIEFDKRNQKIDEYVFFHEDPELAIGDRIVVTAGPSRVGDVLKVIAFKDRSAGFGVLFGALCEEER